MSTWFILNPKAGSAADHEDLIERARADEQFELRKTAGPGDAERLTREACVAGAARVIAAGGDGTVNEVLNGMAGHLDRVTLGVLPLGTGNDVARSLGLPVDPKEAIQYITETDDARQIDVMRVSHPTGSRLAINHVNAGYSNMVSGQLTPEVKQRWGPFAYIKEAASQLRERPRYHTRIKWGDGSVDVVDAVNVLIANGRTVAGGLRVAPDASLEDGAAVAIVLLSSSVVELAGMAARAVVGSLLESDHVIARRSSRMHIETDPPMLFNVDGETFCERVVDIRVLPGALRVVVGPDYVVETEG